MIRRKNWIVVTFILVSCLTACGKQVTDDNGSKNVVVEEPISTIGTEDIESITSTEADTNIVEKEEESETDSDRNSTIESYRSILEDFYSNHTFPDGKDYGFDDSYDVSDNQFAVYDIDQDGKEELIIEYTTTAMAGMIEKIYDINSSTNTVFEEFSEFPNLTYYDNGVIEAGWSHNQGLAGEFWPYTLYQYDQDSDTYKVVGMVDAWDKSMSETNFDGNPFPADADKDGDGIVYYIMLDGTYKLDNPVDLEEYNQWYHSYVDGAEKVDIPLMKLTEENINSMK